jgi:hypothetical protein
MPGQLGFELDGCHRSGRLIQQHRHPSRLFGLTQKALKRNFSIGCCFSLQLGHSGAKLSFS